MSQSEVNIFSKHKLLHERVEVHALRSPQNIAIITPYKSTTYSELQFLTNQIARYILRTNPANESIVGVCMERTAGMIATLLGIMKSGCAYLPIDPSFPEHRKQTLIAEAGCKLIISDPEFISDFQGVGCKAIDFNKITDSAPVLDFWPEINDDHLCYVLFTSGSTGKPKGVMIDHQSVMNYLDAFEKLAPSGDNHSGTSICPYIFDVSVWEFFSVLCFGGTLHLLDPQSILDIDKFTGYLSENNIKSAYLAPGILEDLAIEFEKHKEFCLPDRILVGVEPILQKTLQRFRDLRPAMKIVNGYGPTEATISCTFFVFENADQPNERTPIGKAIEGYKIHLVNSSGSEVQTGESGEILVGGKGLSRGYVNNPALTQQAFIPNPFSDIPGDRLYKTGDLGHYLPDGNIVYDSRSDFQLKIRGYRIEPGEIEAIMMQSGFISECVVIGRENNSGIKYLVLYWSFTDLTVADESVLREYAESKLPDYMIPDVFVFLTKLPRNQSGKIERSQLPDIKNIAKKDTKAIPIQSEAEIGTVWEEVLGIKNISREDNFFSIGGHSIKAAQVIARLNHKFGTNHTVGLLFKSPTIAELTKHFLITENKTDVIPVKNTRQTVYRLSYNQERPYILDRYKGSNALYNIPMVLRLNGHTEIGLLEEAIGNITSRHEIFRTSFGEVNGVPAQIIHPYTGFKLINHDLRPIKENQEHELDTQIQEELSFKFNLATGPLFRASVYMLTDTSNILFLNVHHIISDGWSIGLLLTEIARNYEILLQKGTLKNLNHLTQYASFTDWQRQTLSPSVTAGKLAEMAAVLEGVPTFLSLPTDIQRPAEFTFNGASEYFYFSATLTQNIAQLAKNTASSNFIVLMSAFGILLSEYSRQKQFIVGTMAANRQLPEFENVYGFFTNTVLLTQNLDGNPDFLELIERTRSSAIHTFANQDLPFELLLEHLNPERNLSYNPLYQVMLVYQNMPLDDLQLRGLEIHETEIEKRTSKIDLTLTFDEVHGQLRGLVEYNNDLFTKETIKRLIGHLEHVLDQVVQRPDKHISEITLATENELNKLKDWSVSSLVLKNTLQLSDLLNEAFREHSSFTAITQGRTSFTYGDLNRQVKRLSEYIKTLQLPEHSPVAIIAARTPATITAMLACIRTSHPFVPIDPGNPVARVTDIITEAAISHILSSRVSTWREVTLPIKVALTLIEDITYNQAYDLKEATRFTINPDLPAYIIFTSGSTGKPKGVVIKRSSLANFIQSTIQTFSISHTDKVLQFASLTFDTSLEEIFPCFCSGGTLIMRTDDMLSSHQEFLSRIKKSEVTILDLPTAYWNQLVITMEHEALTFPDSLRLIILGGEAVGSEYVKIFEKVSNKKIKLANTYGPTETTVVASTYFFKPDFELPWVPIGKPVANTEVFVVNEHNYPVPPGIPGELLIGGNGVAIGYLNQPELTTEKFIQLNLSTRQTNRYYKTGDLVRFNSEGELIFLGRTDYQIKIRGFRVEPGEIENHLLMLPGVTEAVVMLRDDRPGISLLTAYIVQKNSSYDIKYYKERLKELVPEYMIPQVFVPLNQIPLNRQGKVDRKLLPAPDFDSILSEKEYIEPVTPLQLKLALIWKDVLHCERIGINDHFFELGGNSIMATQLISRVNNLSKGEFPLKVLFMYPTIAAMERYILSKDFKQKIKASRITRQTTHLPVPASSTQRRIWFLHQFEGSSVAYNIPLAYQIHGDIDQDILEKTFDEVVARHVALRSCIRVLNNEPYIHIEPKVKIHIELIDLRNFSPEEKKAEVALLSKNHALHVFNLAMVPLFKFSLLRLEPHESLLLLNFHHLILDNWSAGIFIKECTEIYSELLQKQPLHLPQPKLQYTDYVLWQNEFMKSDSIKKQVEYWNEELKGAPESIQLPLDHSRKLMQTFNGAEVRQLIDIETTQQLKDYSLNAGVSIYATLLSAFAAVLYRYTNQEDLMIGCPVANRNHEDSENIMGVFINNLPLRVSVSQKTSFREFNALINQKLLDAYENQDLPFEKMIEGLNLKRNINTTPLFQVMFNLLNAHNQNLSFPGCQVHYVDPGRFVSKLDLSLIMMETDGVLHAVFEYNSDLFKYKTIKSLSSHYITFLKSVLDNPDAYLDTVNIMTVQEYKKIVTGFNNTKKEYPSLCFHEIFTQAATRFADNIAVKDEKTSLTYRELDKRSSVLATHLVKRGLKPGKLAGVMLQRGVNLALACIAVMKAGGTYVPLDPVYPRERIGQITDDAGISLFITQNSLIKLLPAVDAEFINLDDDSNFLTVTVALPKVSPDDPVYVIFTSGSTGRPKGVQVTHRGLVNFLWSMKEQPGINQNDRLLAITTVSFDIAGLEFYLPLTAGATVVIASAEEAMDADQLIEKLKKENITILQATPITWRMLMMTNWNGYRHLKALCGGEALQQDLSNQLVARCREVWNMYGPTETTIWSTISLVKHHDIPEGYEPIGKPIGNTLVYVLDRNLNPVPAGVPGELFIGGDGVASGYYNRPELTSESFLMNPFDGKTTRIYRTGDLVKINSEGILEYISRLDNQVKIRGFRIELGEIESVITRFNGIIQTVVTVREDIPNSKRIIAYIVKKENTTINRSDLRLFLAGLLPEYMIPSAFVVLETLPLTPNGKIDRKRLPAPDTIIDTALAEYAEPTGETEILLAKIWNELLKREKISANDDFFALGGHSLLAVSMMGRIENETRKRIPLATLFSNSKLSSLAKIIEAQENENDWRSLVHIKPFGNLIPLFLIHGAGLNVMLYNTLINSLSIDQPVYGLQAKGLNGIDKPLETIEEIAAHYISEIKTEYPVGPYALAGFSLGGIIAFEMVRQMMATGDEVALLGMLDTIAHTSDKHLSPGQKKKRNIKFFFNQLIFNTLALIHEPGELKSKMFLWKIKSLERKFKSLIFRIRAHNAYVAGDKDKLPSFLHNVHEINNRAGEDYVLKPSDVAIELFKAAHQTFYIEDKKTYGWDKFARKGVNIHTVPGEHSTLFWPPNDVPFAHILQKRLDEVNTAYQLRVIQEDDI